ncbi:hypothetical protein Malapachy_0269 [Malassezia pachydermatis]|uniref:Uncharacterized protein n=1 Tax=Malassezia pachydermatis TaxID=77020 RepID=A0A0M9VNF6_9BASI|nr:hypothetical protein Malapachy_0269 [Malassezia pachydermatis]KOS13313.1 hypothetical protein Malapachy_0269 [Malassezia pachydermatis]
MSTPSGTTASSPTRGSASHGIVREHAPTRIGLSHTSPDGSAMRPSSSHRSSLYSPHGPVSPSLVYANEMPDDPNEVSQLSHLFPSSLAPAWSPGGPSSTRSPGARTDDNSQYFPSMPVSGRQRTAPVSPSASRSYLPTDSSRSMYDRRPKSAHILTPPPMPRSPILQDQRLSPSRGRPRPLSAHILSPGIVSSAQAARRRTPDTNNIFERDIELNGTPHALRPQEAIDLAVPSVLHDAAHAIVGDSTLEIISPRSESTRASSPLRPGETLSRGLSHDGSHVGGRTQGGGYGHRRLRSDHSNIYMPTSPSVLSQAGSRRSMLLSASPGSQSESLAPSMSPSLSIDGAIIPDNQAATVTHSLDELADVMAHIQTDKTAMLTPGSYTGAGIPMSSPMSTAASSSYFSLQPHADDNRHSKFRYQLLDMPAGDRSADRSHSVPPPRPVSFTAGLRGSRHTVPAPGAEDMPDVAAMPHLQVPQGQVPLRSTSSQVKERKRLSWMSYTDLVHDVDEQVTDFDASMRRS